ncbi:MAG: sugar ABC transporter permease [Clostridia bacterium]|nr:sugar ABC transporter permease [Clostridia bacterium]MBR2969291.1 sugar ABC transporter permease [Clostridia bacterium]
MSKISLKIKRTVKNSYTGWLFNLPLAIGIGVFTLVPVLMSLFDSFFSYDGLNNADSRIWVGMANYVRIFTKDRDMQKVVVNTLVYTIVSIPINLVASYFLALLVNSTLKGVTVYRVFYYLPCMIPAVAGGLLWADMFDGTFGLFNKFLGVFGIGPFDFFKSEDMSALVSVFIMNLWSVGGGMILWLSAFKNIGKHYYEAAILDGANAWHRLVHITIPMSSAMIFYNVITSVIGTLQYNGTLTFGTRNGRGENNALYMYAVKIYYEAFEKGKIGYASALAWLMLIVIAIVTFIMFRTSSWVFYAEEN